MNLLSYITHVAGLASLKVVMAGALYLLMTLFTTECTLHTLLEYEMFLSFECLLTHFSGLVS
jgi:hypothetical protein